MKKVQPLLAKKAEFDKIQYPVLATPKLDGIRCLMVDGVAMSRTMKPIPNKFIQEQLKGLDRLDGELMVSGGFNEVSSGIMNSNGEPNFTYHVFDCWSSGAGYSLRMEDLEFLGIDDHPRCKLLMPIQINNEDELTTYLDECLEAGYEGVMIRDPKGPYKFGRSTVKEGILLKVKRFLDDEAVLVDVIEQMHNTNDQERDELGKSKRSSAKDGLVPAGTAGSVTLEWKGKRFNCGFGPGFTNDVKQAFWDDRENKVGKLFKFSYQELTADGIPRFGKLLGERHLDDL